MRRKHVHIAFALTAAVFATAAAHQTVKLRHADRVNEAIASARSGNLDPSIPEARFAHAAALADAGEYEAAVQAYKALTQAERGEIKYAAQFNLGNVHMREASKHGAADSARWLPMIELAKQSYRNLLREHPPQWDARYNLELALRLAPEFESMSWTGEDPRPDSERATSTISNSMMELP